MGKRVLFVPFHKQDDDAIDRPGNEYGFKNANWARSQAAKKATIQEANEGDFHDLFVVTYERRFSGFLTGLGADDQIYIRGHGLPDFAGVFDLQTKNEQGVEMKQFGSKNLMNRDLKFALTNFGHEVKPYFSLSAKEVVRRLQISGLRKGFAGKIKCYNCHSADNPESFAYALADELTAAGYTRCGVYGYVGALSSEGSREHTPDSANRGAKGMHKASLVKSGGGASERLGTGSDRASNRRVEIRAAS